jgi:hypothetical protein
MVVANVVRMSAMWIGGEPYFSLRAVCPPGGCCDDDLVFEAAKCPGGQMEFRTLLAVRIGMVR